MKFGLNSSEDRLAFRNYQDNSFYFFPSVGWLAGCCYIAFVATVRTGQDRTAYGSKQKRYMRKQFSQKRDIVSRT